MGISAAEFNSSDTTKQTLDRRIRPTDDQFEDQRDRWNDLAEFLLADLKGRTGYPVSSWLQGSYKFGTQIRPATKGHEFDIDLGIYFEWEGDPDDGTYSPKELKAAVHASLLAYAADANNDADAVDAPPKARCSRIHFGDDFHIDVPSYHLDPDRDDRSLATESDEWEESDPKAIYLWFRDLFDEANRTAARRLVRYLKMWNALTFHEENRPSSILTTVLVADALKVVDIEAAEGDDDLLLAVVEEIISRLDRDGSEVPNPVNSDENLNRLSDKDQTAFRDALERLREIAETALGAATAVEAAETWSEVFAQFFPIPDETALKEERSGRAVAAIRFTPEVAVRAVPQNNPNRVFTGLNGIGPIPRDCSIDFTLQNSGQLPWGAEVRWMVRNQGGEAETENDLGHRAGKGPTATERSAYNGTHFMDVSVHLGNQLIGYRRVRVVI